MYTLRMWEGHGVLLRHRIPQILLVPSVMIRSLMCALNAHYANEGSGILWMTMRLPSFVRVCLHVEMVWVLGTSPEAIHWHRP